MVGEDEGPVRKPSYSIGQPLDDLSIEEIDDLIKALAAETERLRRARESKFQHLDAARALFGKK